MIKAFPTPYRYATATRSGTGALNAGDIVKILSNGSVAALTDSGTAVAYGIYHGMVDGKHIIYNGIVVGFASDATAPTIGATAYIVNANTVSGSNSGGSRPALGTTVGVEGGKYLVYVKGLLN